MFSWWHLADLLHENPHLGEVSLKMKCTIDIDNPPPPPLIHGTKGCRHIKYSTSLTVLSVERISVTNGLSVSTLM